MCDNSCTTPEEVFKKKLYDKVGDMITLVGEYRGSKVKTTFQCKLCKRTW